MTNKELWQQYKEYTSELTANSRKLAFAATAICWLFKNADNSFPDIIFNALGYIAAFFLADILQYFLSAILLRAWIRKQEIKKWNEGDQIEGSYYKPEWLDKPAYIMWWLKTGFLFTAYASIGVHVFFK